MSVNFPPVTPPSTRDQCVELDLNDSLGFARQRFLIPEGLIYLDGNSLGALPASVPNRLHEVVTEEWGNSLIRSWNIHGWMETPGEIGAGIARLLGAANHTVMVADNTSTNLFKLVTAAIRLRPERRVILTDSSNFPTDLYVLEGIASVLGHEIRRVNRDELVGAIDNDTALVAVTQVDYRTGDRLELQGLTSAAHHQGALMLWDLAHSAGAFETNLVDVGADFAVGCGYKYLNGGPGAPAFCYVNERWLDDMRPMLQGWLGHAAPFDFAPHYQPAAGVQRLVVGTAPVLSLMALSEGVKTFDGVDMAIVRNKSLELTELFIRLVDERLAGFGFTLATTRDPGRRGSQVSFMHDNGYPIVAALAARNVIGDFRAPNIVRFGIAPLYVRYVDIFDAVEHLLQIMRTREWDQPHFHHRQAVT